MGTYPGVDTFLGYYGIHVLYYLLNCSTPLYLSDLECC